MKENQRFIRPWQGKRFRLGCTRCDRNDYDGIDHLPDTWQGIIAVEELSWDDPAGREQGKDDCPFEWRTHVGLCPVCQATRRVDPILQQIIDRDCHVSLTHKEVVRYIISRLRNKWTTFRSLPKGKRRRLIHQCQVIHQHNREIFIDVMQGQLNRVRFPKRPAEHHPRSPQMTGHEVQRLMRRQRMTIKRLSEATGITQKRIRQIRQQGLSDPESIRDWQQAITGTDPGPVLTRYRINLESQQAVCTGCQAPMVIGDEVRLWRTELYCSQVCFQQSRLG